MIFNAVEEILQLSLDAFVHNDLTAARYVEPLEQVIDELKETLRTRHILRLQQGECTISAGFIWSDLLTNLERISDHCSNIAGCVFDVAHNNMNLHETLKNVRNNSVEYNQDYKKYKELYLLP